MSGQTANQNLVKRVWVKNNTDIAQLAKEAFIGLLQIILAANMIAYKPFTFLTQQKYSLTFTFTPASSNNHFKGTYVLQLENFPDDHLSLEPKSHGDRTRQ